MASGSSIDESSGSADGSSGPAHHYDPQTGQTYYEWKHSRSHPVFRSSDWENESRLYQDSDLSGPPEKGVRSLVDMLVTKVSKNSHLLDSDALDEVPPHLLHDIWDELNRISVHISLHSFMMLSRLLSENQRTYHKKAKLPKAIFKYHRSIKNAASPLANFTKPLMAQPLDFIVHLTLAGNQIYFETHELLALTELKNLGVLEIVQPHPIEDAAHFPRVNDSVIRHWASIPDSFPLLRVLRIWGDYFTTRRSLEYLNKFPALRVYDVAGKKKDWAHASVSPPWKKSTYKLDWTLLETITETIKELSSSSVYAHSAKAYSLMACWMPMFNDIELPEWIRDPSEMEVEMIVGDKEATEFREKVSADEHQLYAFHHSLKHGLLDESIRHWFWGYVLYCHIGRLTGNEDLVKKGMHDPQESFVINNNLLPPRPYIEVNLGDFADTDDCQDFEYHCTFARALDLPSKKRRRSPSADSGPSTAPAAPAESSKPGPSRKLTKRQKFFDLKDL
ncbi:uncharacterized protein GGS22DRAFT_197266 [Annulohypoxylon maeteangense]|uniref:uncharacterized protein n=1 Tax=Annulohypoxylon maeteangense TaxID=1927788 RepID=UPI0020078897|nr:uncharacterized protein GGS22DRAFT_197266 [Annulohypoxylon maeteangense]KAI0880940.1 hypothetical protein GGS22DRAFT_197266 [Annulohypoxylon maeteangense]